ncbi:glycoside hydrolase family 2 protein [Oceanobacillus senegalensis]|uniref:glycoside hydrolase family 2 protein n=1 Tax=Oceanobacillus senegalensis TaxID=1936063 RepID=UPI0015C44689|nr:sugar-binding domain-containing protein [Oceanobacillus senegalensis]
MNKSRKQIISLVSISIIFILTVLCGSSAIFAEGKSSEEKGPGYRDFNSRVKMNFNPNWKFYKGDVEGAEKPNFDDSDWETVSLPHTFNDVDTFNNYMEGGHNGERSMYTGKTWYRKEFDIDKEHKQKKVFIEFEAARQAADVYINGTKLEGKSENGFIPFGYDITPYLNKNGKGNVIAVMVDNSFPYLAEESEGDEGILSWHDSHWHPTHGGLYRNVYLHFTDKLHVTLPLYSFLETQGTYVHTANISENSADVTVEAEVYNEHKGKKKVEYIVEIVDHDGNIVETMKDSKRLNGGEKYIFSETGTVAEPHLWSPDYPYLYKAVTKLAVNNKIVDEYETTFGIRTWEFTNTQGFFINGNHVKLEGWGQKSTNEWAGLGSAFPDWMHDYTMKMMKDAGGNFVRWGHTAGSPTQIESADKYGIVTMQPGVDGEGSTVGGVYSDISYDIRSAAFRDMIIYYRNHPSILVWEGGNQSVPEKEAERMKEIIETWDPHGERNYAHRRSNSAMGKYIDLAIGTEGSWELRDSGIPVVEGEYNREEAPRRAWDRYTPGYEDFETAEGSAYNLTSEEFAVNQVKHYSKISNPAHSGGGNWIFSDSTSHGRVYSEVTRASGEVDAVRLPKEAYFATKAMFHDEPQIHIIGHWNYPEGTEKDVFVVSNAKKVELRINGESKGLGSKSFEHLFTFEDIAWEEGNIEAIAYDAEDNVIATQEKETAGEPVAVKLTPITGPEGLLADGSDILLIDAEVVDADGNRVPTYEGRIDFEMEGPGIWRGGYNSGKENSTNNEYLDIEAGINRVAVRSTLESGTITVTGKIEGLESDSVEVEANAVKIKAGQTTQLPVTPSYELPEEEPSFGDGPDEDVEDSDGTSKKVESQLITNFSYSGINEPYNVKANTQNGSNVYSDTNDTFTNLPIYLLGGEYIQVPNADKDYQALDLMHFTINEKADVYIAHDNRIETPAWLAEEYTNTNEEITLSNATYTLYKKTVESGTTLTLGGNKEGKTDTGNMYVVFAKETSKEGKIVYDTFDTQETGKFPVGWDVTEGLDTSVQIAETPSDTNKSLHFVDNNSSLGALSRITAIKNFSPITDNITIEWRVRANEVERAEMNLATRRSYAIKLNISNGSFHYIDSNGNENSIQRAEPKKWYTIKVVANASSGMYDLYIDDEQKLSDEKFTTPVEELSSILFMTGEESTADLNIDDLKVYK